MAAATIEQLFERALGAIREQDYEACAKHCTAILGQAPDDQDARHCQGLSYLHLGRFDEALKALPASLNFERAYCLYRLQRLPESLSELDQASNTSTASSSSTPSASRALRNDHLRAQIFYRQGEFSRAFDVYDQMRGRVDQSSKNDLVTNLLASAAASSEPRLINESVRLIQANEQIELYEFAYNASCVYLALGNFDAALQRIDKALDICRKEFTTGGEFQDEAAVLLAQRAYLLHSAFGRTDEAIAVYDEILKNPPSDRQVQAVAANNLVALDKAQKHLASEHKLEKNVTPDVLSKLSEPQKRIARLNYAIALLRAGKTSKCEELCESLGGSDSETAMVVRAAILSTQGRQDEARAVLSEGAAQGSVRAQLSLAQLELGSSESNYGRVIEVLRSVKSLQHTPGWVGSLVWLHQQLNETDQALLVLEEAVSHWSASSHPKAAQFSRVLLRATAQYSMSHHRYTRAAAAYQSLLQSSVSSSHEATVYLARLVNALSYFDIEAAKNASQKLPAPSLDISQIDATQLENLPLQRSARAAPATPIISSSSSSSSAALSSDAAQAPRSLKTKAKRKRRPNKKRLPANYDPKYVHRDVQRWMPLAERAYYKKQQRRERNRNNQIDRSAQGVYAPPPSGSVQASSVKSGASAVFSSPTPAAAKPTVVAPSPTPAPPGRGKYSRGRGRRR